MIVLVTGGRGLKSRELVWRALDKVTKGVPTDTIVLVHGNARGADELADKWALDRDVQVARCPAPWDKWPVSAGPIRNKRMLILKPDVVVAFPGGAGTAHMVQTARDAGIKVVVICEQ